MTTTTTEHEHGKDVLDALNPLHRDCAARSRTSTRGSASSQGSVRSRRARPGHQGADRPRDRGRRGLRRLHRLPRPGRGRAGATRQEAAEAIGVTFLMKGGPATIYGPRAYDAFCEFADATA